MTQLGIADVLVDATRGHFPPADGGIDVVPVPDGEVEAVLALTGHAVLQTTMSVAAVRAAGADGFGGATSPTFLTWLAAGGWIGSLDVVLWAPATGIRRALSRTNEFDDHPRVVAARRIRRGVEVLADEDGVVTIGLGLGDQWELGVEVLEARRATGAGRRLIAAARASRPEGEPLFAHVAPGNAASLRVFLASGFTPVGSVVLLRPGPRR